MRTARSALAMLLAFAIPLRAETTADPLWYLLSTYVLAPDAKAIEAQGDGPADSRGLAALQADLLVLTEGFEGFRDEAQVKETLERLKPRMSPELRPFFKDRASSLDAIYRTLAVTDYTWAQRFPEPLCEPLQARRKLLASRDGLFQTEKGEASPWLLALLGPQAEGKSAEQALDQASSQAKLTGAEYEKLRSRVRKLTMALASEKAIGSARSKLYCSRAAAFTDLAAAQRVKDAALISAARVVAQKPEESVFVVVWKNQRAAATFLNTRTGPVLLTDAAIVADTDHPNLFAYSANAKPVQLTATVVRRHSELGVAVLTYAEDLARPSLPLAETAPAKDELVTAVGHTQISGLWTKTSGLVTKVGEVSFQTDAAISPELSGGPVLNEAGAVAGMLVLRPADTEEGRWPVAIPAPILVRWLDDSTFTSSTAQAEVIEDDGTAAVLTRARPIDLTEAGLGAWNIPNLPPPPSVPHGVCVQNCGGGSSSGSSSSGGYSGSGGEELGKALGELGAVLILKGLPALFRGIGKLFKGPGKSGTKSNPTSSITKQSVPTKPEPPPKPKLPLRPLKMTLKVDKDTASRGEAVRLTAEVEFTGELGSQAGLAVTFTADPDLFEFPAGSISSTDIHGRAAVDVIIKTDASEYAHEDLEREIRRQTGEVVEPRTHIPLHKDATAVAKVKSAALRGDDSLDAESDRVDTEESTSITESTPREHNEGPVEAAAGFSRPQASIIAESSSISTLGTRLGSLNATKDLTLGKCRRGTVARTPPDMGSPGQSGVGSPEKALLEERCKKDEEAAQSACGSDEACRNALLRSLGYDFRSCIERWKQDGGGGGGSIGNPPSQKPNRPPPQCISIAEAKIADARAAAFRVQSPGADGEGETIPPGGIDERVSAPWLERICGFAEILFTRKKLQHEFKHAGQFGIAGATKGTGSNTSLRALQKAVMNHIKGVSSPIKGTFGKLNVYHFFNQSTKVNVIVDLNGNFVAGYGLSSSQAGQLKSTGHIGP